MKLSVQIISFGGIKILRNQNVHTMYRRHIFFYIVDGSKKSVSVPFQNVSQFQYETIPTYTFDNIRIALPMHFPKLISFRFGCVRIVMKLGGILIILKPYSICTCTSTSIDTQLLSAEFQSQIGHEN